MHVLIRVRILIGVGVLKHAPERLGFQHHPRAFSFFKIVGDLHARSGCPTRLWTKLNFRMGLVPVDREATNIHDPWRSYSKCRWRSGVARCRSGWPRCRSPAFGTRSGREARRLVPALKLSVSCCCPFPPASGFDLWGGRLSWANSSLVLPRVHSPCRGPG